MKKMLFSGAFTALCILGASATPVTVNMNAVSTTMTLSAKGSETPVETGEPSSQKYTFEAPAGEYVLTAIAKDGTTVNGTLTIAIPDTDEPQTYDILTCTAYVTNKNDDGSVWTMDKGDYTFKVTVRDSDGNPCDITGGNSVTAGRNTFLALKGNSYRAEFIPSDAHAAEGYTTLYKAGTVTFNANVNGAIPMSYDYSISVPADAGLFLGMKFTHFTDFTAVEPKKMESSGECTVYTYSLAAGQVYNYRTWKEGGLTQAGYFTMNADESKRPEINFTADDYIAYSPTQVNHSAESNKGYETGDILLNINAQGHLTMNVGDVYAAHAMRSWELTDNSTNNYFMEPDFHYTVLDTDGKPSSGVIEIENADTSVSPWCTIKAVGTGTAIVLVTYDAIALNYYSGAERKEYLGGEFWGAVWPENTGVYVVTVGETAAAIEPDMFINEDYDNSSKLAGKNVDAELDVFYYLDTEAGAEYTFTPRGVADVAIACPNIGAQTVSYNGFTSDGVTKNDDGSYTLLLKQGRNIVRMIDASGKSVYQILTAKECHREIVNETRAAGEDFRPGDTVKIQYSGLFHPANKLAGIYNMSAFLNYTSAPEGTSPVVGSSQYTFGSSAAAQAVSVVIPEDWDTSADFVLANGVIQLKGFGDPVGSHRDINPVAGRSPNFTAISHSTVLGSVPDVCIEVTSETTGIENISADDIRPVTYYNPEGLSSDHPFNGINIVRYSDGTIKKLYIHP